MIPVIVIFPDGTKDTGRIDPSLPYDEILEDIVNAFDLGDPKDFSLAFTPKFMKQSPQDYTPSPGDIIRIYRAKDARGPAFERD